MDAELLLELADAVALHRALEQRTHRRRGARCSGSRLAYATHTSACGPFVIHIFVPFST
jgi:hypothetical protein